MYAFGNSTPTAKHCTTRTMRENSKVMKSTLPHVPGSIKVAAWGPKMIPQSVATVASPMYRRSLITEEHNMNSVVKPPKMMYTKWGLLTERWSHAMVFVGSTVRCRLSGLWWAVVGFAQKARQAWLEA